MTIKLYNATLRNLEYRLRAFRDILPDVLEDIIAQKEDVIISAISNDQLYRRGINGQGKKIMSYMPYTATTIKIKKQKNQPTTRVTLRDTGSFHESMYLVFEPDGFYITSSDLKTEKLKEKYGDAIFRLTNSNFNRIVRSHLRKELSKQLKRTIKG